MTDQERFRRYQYGLPDRAAVMQVPIEDVMSDTARRIDRDAEIERLRAVNAKLADAIVEFLAQWEAGASGENVRMIRLALSAASALISPQPPAPSPSPPPEPDGSE